MTASRRTLSAPAAVLIIVLLGAATFGRATKFKFVSWDDYQTIAGNLRLNPPTSRSIASFWTRPQMDLYAPVTYTVWAFTANAAAKGPVSDQTDAWALDARVFHALNLVLHVAAGAMVFLLLRELLGGADLASLPALAGALLFVLHPVQVEPVAWVSGMKDVLMGLFALAAVWQYVRLARDEKEDSLVPAGEWWGRYGIALLLFVLAMLSKPTAIVTPLVVIVLDRLMLDRPWKKVLAWTWPWMVLAIPVAIVAKLAQPAAAAHADAAPLWARPLLAADALAFYLYKLIWPARMTFDYGRTPAVVLRNGWHYYTWIAPAAVAVALFLFRRRVRPIIAAALISLTVLLPVLGLIPFDFQSYSTVADHYLYLAMLGPALALAWALSRRENAVTLSIAGVVLLLLGGRTFYQARHWRDSNELFRHTLAINPSSFASYNNLAVAAIDEHRLDDAIGLSRLAIQLSPNYPQAYLTRADALRQRGNTAAAMADYRRALELLPDNAPALTNLAALLAAQGQLTDALPLARRAVEIAPDMPQARLNLARMYVQQEDLPSARRELEAVLQLTPDDTLARELLSRLATSESPPAPKSP